jgi:hypothetical protein
MQRFVATLKGILKRGCFVLLVMMFILMDIADCGQRTYYSIHFASFKNLKNANKQLNAFKINGKMVFWKKINVPEKGIFYRVYLGKYRDRERAVAFWEKLNQAGEVSYFGVHKFTETVDRNKIIGHKTLLSSVKKDRFLDNQDGTLTDTETNLMWIKNGWSPEFFSAVTWDDAVKKCRDFKQGGYTDWSLPTVDEWRMLIDTKKQCPALVEPNPFDNIIVHMPYWSGSELNKSPVQAYTVMLYSGTINHQNKKERAFILPVRSID